jgi:hypothetical protein
MASAPAQAQATRTWVSGVGDDVNPCSRTAPCKTFAGAISKTAAGGEINCLDSGGFGGVTVGKSLTILCEGVVGGVLVSGSNGVLINAGANDVIVLKGLDIEGLGMTTSSLGLNGVKVLAAAAVHIEDCIIRNFRAAAPNGFAIQFANTTALAFSVTNTSMINNGTGATGGAIQIRPTANATKGTISKSVASRNIFGIAADGAGGSTGINVAIDSSDITGNVLAGVVSTTGAVGTGIMVMRSTVSHNGTGFQTSGAGANIRVGEALVTGNINATSGTVNSYSSNQVNGNGNDGVFAPIPKT